MKPVRLLIVDDEPAVRAIVGRVLAVAGYEVVLAADGAEALQRYQGEGPFALVLLDESMPGMSGHAALERLLQIDPAAKVVLFTGSQAGSHPAPGAAGVLEKPVPMDSLLEYLRRVLEPGAGGS